MQEIIRWIGMIIIVVSMIIALVYGTIEAIDLVKDLATPAQVEQKVEDLGEQVDIQTGSAEKDNDSWKEHLKGISLAGLDIAVLATAWFEGKEYYDDLKSV